MLIHSLERNSKSTYIYRLYPEERTLRYAFSMPITYRGNGEWEVHAWNSVYKLWPIDKERPKLQELLFWLHNELEERHKPSKFRKFMSDFLFEAFGCKRLPYFKKLTAVIETTRMGIYRRLFRKYFLIDRIYDITKEYNGATLVGHYVEFIPIKRRSL